MNIKSPKIETPLIDVYENDDPIGETNEIRKTQGGTYISVVKINVPKPEMTKFKLQGQEAPVKWVDPLRSSPKKTAKVDMRKSNPFGDNKYPSALNINAMK